MSLHIEQVNTPCAQAIARELSQGLLAQQASISPKYLYDELGSRLFEAITELPEYTPFRDERDLFETQLHHLAQALPFGGCLIDLGAGSCRKGSGLIHPLAVTHYLAIDISSAFLRGSLELLARNSPQARITGLGLDFSEGLPAGLLDLYLDPGLARIFLYAGSSIGNFHPPQALGFLRGLVTEQSAHALLIGVDLVRDAAQLQAAYDDALGVTAAFNRNLLLHLNALLQADFQLPDWAHRALFDPHHSRIEMHLVARRPLTVRWGQAARSFAPGETIHTENSYKYTVDGFVALLEAAGFAQIIPQVHPSGRYALFLALTDRNPEKTSVR